MASKKRNLENYEDIMGATATDVHEPSLYPEGPWTLRNVGFSATDVEDRDGNPQKLLNLRYEGFEAGPEVDPEEVEKGGFEGKTIWVRRYISKPLAKASRDGTLARFIKFARLHGIDTEELNIEAMCKALKGQQIQAQIGTRSYTTREGDAAIDNTATDFSSIEA